MRRILGVTWWLGCAALLAAGPAAASPAAAPRELDRETVLTALATGKAELVNLETSLVPNLLRLAPGDSLAVADWPLAPGVREEVELAPFEVYAKDARIIEMVGNRAVDLPRSRLAFFRGRSLDGSDTRLVVSVDPDSERLEAVVSTADGTLELKPWTAGPTGEYVVAAADALRPTDGEEAPSWSCGQQQHPLTTLFAPVGLQAVTGAAITSLHTATIAVDTDNELMNLKFGNNTTAATNYIANLIARMNVMYERDLLVRLVQGFTILRPSTTADPYSQNCTVQVVNGTQFCSANSAQLGEFSNYWSAGCGGSCTGVARALTMMLSGKSTPTNSASGIAWVDSLCSIGTGYSFSQVFKFAQDTSANDGKLVGHEIGHNFGSPHTHCYAPPIDTCYNGEACYTGSTSCPAATTINGVPNVTGTVMSYCHLTGCGSQEVFHSRSVDLIAPKIQSRVGQCIFPLGPSNLIFANGFEAGSLPAPWAAKSP